MSSETVEQFQVEAGLPPGRSLRTLLARGSSTLGVASVIERGCGFLANLLAARAAGPQSFGAYAVVLATAGSVATYAGAGIGSTANRFSGEFPIGSKGYKKFLRTIILVSLTSAFLASLLMLAGAGPLARVLLKNEGLVSVLRIAALSAGALIVIECARGLFIGQQKFQGLLLLSLTSGVGMLLVLPGAAHIGPGAMIAGQAGVAILAVSVCVVFARRLGMSAATSIAPATEASEGPGVRAIVTFGMIQLSAVVGINIASWWLASLVARSDATLLQMGMYAVANQFRGLTSIMPGLLAQISYPLLTIEAGRQYGGPERVLLVNTYLSTSLAVSVAGIVIVLMPWILFYLYGRSYVGAEIPAVLALATAIIHMGSIPAAYRLSIVNLRAIGVINTIWALIVVSLGILFVPLAGAAGAVAAFFFGHLFSQLAVLVMLKRAGTLPRGLLSLTLTGIVAAASLVLLGYFRAAEPSIRQPLTAALIGVVVVLTFVFLRFGQRQAWLPKLFGR